MLVQTNIFTHEHTHGLVWLLWSLCASALPVSTPNPSVCEVWKPHMLPTRHQTSPLSPEPCPHYLCLSLCTWGACLRALNTIFVYCSRCGDFIGKIGVMYLAMAHYGWGIFAGASGISKQDLIAFRFIACVSWLRHLMICLMIRLDSRFSLVCFMLMGPTSLCILSQTINGNVAQQNVSWDFTFLTEVSV